MTHTGDPRKGHATSAFTADVYTEVAEELAEAVATAIAALVPRRQRQVAEAAAGPARCDSPAVRAINVPSRG